MRVSNNFRDLSEMIDGASTVDLPHGLWNKCRENVLLGFKETKHWTDNVRNTGRFGISAHWPQSHPKTWDVTK